MAKLLLICLSLISVESFAGFKGSISFSSKYKKAHLENIQEFNKIGADCLQSFWSAHKKFYRAHCKMHNGKRVCLSRFYGDRRYSSRRGQSRSDGQRLTYLGDALDQYGFPRSLISKMFNISCVGMALKCLERSFELTGQKKAWKKINKFVKRNSVDGTALQHALQKLGWTIYYWNPAPSDTILSDMKKWDEEEKSWASKGYNSYRYSIMKRKGTYWNNNVDDMTTLVGFDHSEPELLQDIPFWIGTAHTGYHVFPGTYGHVIEAHSTQSIISHKNLEYSRFSPFQDGGGPRWTSTQKYRSGLIAVPPTN